MAFDISQLGSYVAESGKNYALVSVASANTAKALIDSKNVQMGVRGSAAILKLNSDVVLVDASSCGRVANTAVALSNKNIVVKPIADYLTICPEALWNTFYAESIGNTQAPEEEFLPAFANAIMEDRAKKIAFANEQLLWQGNTSLTGATNLNRINGIITQVTGTTGTTLTVTGATIVEELQNMFLQVPVNISEQDDFVIAIGRDTYNKYLVSLALKNIFRPVDDNSIYGTSGKFFVTNGLNGTNQAYALRWSNLVLGMNGDGEADKAELRYSIETRSWYQDFEYSLGIAVIYPNEVFYANL